MDELLEIVDNVWHEGWQTARCQDEPTPEDDKELKRRYVAELEATITKREKAVLEGLLEQCFTVNMNGLKGLRVVNTDSIQSAINNLEKV